MAAYENRYWWSRDGLRLHYRDYPGRDADADGRPPIVCLPGLTRNARDFEALADRLAGEWRVIAVDLRGRGESAYARSEEHTSELQSLMRISYAVFCLKKKTRNSSSKKK